MSATADLITAIRGLPAFGDRGVLAEYALAAADRLERADAVIEGARAALEQTKAHVDELEEAWRRSTIRESDHYQMGGARSNRNIDVRVAAAKALTAIAEYQR